MIYLMGRLFVAALLLMMVGGRVVYAATEFDIIVVEDKKSKVHQSIVTALRIYLIENKATIKITAIDQHDFNKRLTDKSHAILIAPIGTEATETVVSLKITTPVFAVAIPKLSFNKLYLRQEKTPFRRDYEKLSALYIDQPFSRCLELGLKLIPQAKNIGMLFGPSSQADAVQIRSIIKQHKLNLVSKTVSDKSQFTKALDDVLENSDVMCGLIDPLVFNRSNARNILISAYRWRVPLLGLSPAYVRAGALAAVYSTPTQIGQQLAEVLLRFTTSNDLKLPSPLYPKYFDIAINDQVAESFGLIIDHKNTIKQKLLENSGRYQ